MWASAVVSPSRLRKRLRALVTPKSMLPVNGLRAIREGGLEDECLLAQAPLLQQADGGPGEGVLKLHDELALYIGRALPGKLSCNLRS